MSPRLKVFRKIANPPIIKGFKPYGLQFNISELDFVSLFYEEYEAIRLCAYEQLDHSQASVSMGISRPTFTRIYASALQKIGTAFVEGKQICIEGGKVYFDSDWYHCTSCHSYFTYPLKDELLTHCPLCNQNNFIKFDLDTTSFNFSADIDFPVQIICYCTHCGFEISHAQNTDCTNLICPECKNMMRFNFFPSNHKNNNI